MTQIQAITLAWLKQVRPHALGNQDVGSEAWDIFRGGQELGEDSFNPFAVWLVHNWGWYVNLLAERGVKIPEAEKVAPTMQPEQPAISRPYGRSVPMNLEGVTVGATQGQPNPNRFGHRGQALEPADVIRERQNAARLTAQPTKKGGQPISRQGRTIGVSVDKVEVRPFNAFNTIEGILMLLVIAAFLLFLDYFTNRWFVLNVAFGYVELGRVMSAGNAWHTVIAAFLMGSEWYLRGVQFFEQLAENTEVTFRRAVRVTRLAVYGMIASDAIATVLPPIQFFTGGFDFLSGKPVTTNLWFGLALGAIVGVALAGLTWLATAKFPELLIMTRQVWKQRGRR